MKKSKLIIHNWSLALITLLTFHQIGYNQSYIFKDLKKGPFEVGYKSFVKTDYSRSFIYGKDTLFRPVFFNIWYPANITEHVKMVQKDYFESDSDNSRIKQLLNDYKTYNYTIIKELVFEKYEEDQWTETEQKEYDNFLAMELDVYKEAKAIDKKFPLIIYHQGFGASIEDNSALLEFLASHGYVIIGSSFFQKNSKSLSVGNQDSVHDVNYIINYASELPNVDITNIGLIGHSGGAQANIISKTHSQNPIKTVISLDTTQESYGLSDNRWDDFVKPTLKGIDNMDANILAFSDHNAVFQLFNLMENASKRYYITYPHSVNHNEYTSQGIYADYYKLLLSQSNDYTKEEFETDIKHYQSITNYILDFLNVTLKEENNKEWFRNTAFDASQNYKEPIVQTIEQKSVNTSPYAFNKNILPSPMQIWDLAHKNEPLLFKSLNYHVSHKQSAPIFNDIFAFALINQLINNNQSNTAKQLLDFYENNKIKVSERFLSLSKFLILMQRSNYAKSFLSNYLKINPKNSEVLKVLNQIKN